VLRVLGFIFVAIALRPSAEEWIRFVVGFIGAILILSACIIFIFGPHDSPSTNRIGGVGDYIINDCSKGMLL